MQTPVFLLFRSVCRSVVGKGLDGLLGNGSLSDCIRDISSDSLDRYRRDVSLEIDRLAEIASLAQSSIDQIRSSAIFAYDSIRDTATPDIRQIMDRTIVREKVLAYLENIPCMIRSVFRRPTDPVGHTPPSGYSLNEPIDVARILPNRLPRFKNGDRPIGNWALIDLLGLVEHGEVWKGENTTSAESSPAALHFLTLPEATKFVAKEGDLLKRAIEVSGSIPGIVRLHQVHMESHPPCVEYEFVNGGDLCGLINELSYMPRERRAAMAIQILLRLSRTIAPLHAMLPPFIHRDLKPANIFVVRKSDSKFDLKVGDFGIGGLAFLRSTDQPGNQRATPLEVISQSLRGSYTLTYASPEQRLGAAPHTTDDVHALGVIGLQLLLCDLRRGPVGDWDQELADHAVGQNIIEVLRQCFLAKPQRFPHAGALSSALEKLLAEINTAEKNKVAGSITKNLPPLTKTVPAPTTISANVPIIPMNKASGNPDSNSIPALPSRTVTQSQKESPRTIIDSTIEIGSSPNIIPPPIPNNIPPQLPVHEFIAKPIKSSKKTNPLFIGIIITVTVLITLSAHFALVYYSSDEFIQNNNTTNTNRLSDNSPPPINQQNDSSVADLSNSKTNTPPSKNKSHQIGDTIALPLIESIKMKFAWVPPGQSWLGGGDGKEGEIPFTLEKGFWCGIYEITQEEWQEVMGYNPSYFKGKLDHPVEQVSYEDVLEFLKKANTNFAKSGYILRLPSEQEWEYISRGGPISKYKSKYRHSLAVSKTNLTPFLTNNLSSNQANFDGNYPAGSAQKGPYLAKTVSVGQYVPNSLGIYDMQGNVWEWVLTNSGSEMANCGGGWASFGDNLIHSSRNSSQSKFYNLGFRLLAVPVSETNPPISLTEGKPSPMLSPDRTYGSTKSVVQNKPDSAQLNGKQIGYPKWINIGLNSDTSITMVLIPSGKFTMGSPTTEIGRESDEIQRNLVISNPFYMAETEITQAQYLAVMGSNPSLNKNGIFLNYLPIDNATYDEAKAFCQVISARYAHPIQLPTEAQWEYACRAGTDTPFSFGTSFNGSQGNVNGIQPYGSSTNGTNQGKTLPVRSYPSNSFGLYDMHGNVWEWCSDWHGPYNPNDLVDPTGPIQGDRHVLRGGAWNTTPSTGLHRSARRSPSFATTNGTTGFRVILMANQLQKDKLDRISKESSNITAAIVRPPSTPVVPPVPVKPKPPTAGYRFLIGPNASNIIRRDNIKSIKIGKLINPQFGLRVISTIPEFPLNQSSNYFQHEIMTISGKSIGFAWSSRPLPEGRICDNPYIYQAPIKVIPTNNPSGPSDFFLVIGKPR